jgi:hypothetical protein
MVALLPSLVIFTLVEGVTDHFAVTPEIFSTENVTGSPFLMPSVFAAFTAEGSLLCSF